jgi:hypothetical protein
MTPGNQMEGGNLKLSIALGQKPTIIQKGPFYLMKQEAIPSSDVTGATNLMASKGLEHSYIKLMSKIFVSDGMQRRFVAWGVVGPPR